MQYLKCPSLKILITILIVAVSTYNLLGQIDVSKKYSIQELQEMLIKARKEREQANLADVYFLLAQYQEKEKFNTELALDFYIQAKIYYENTGNGDQANVIKSYIADRYYKSGFYKESLELYSEILKYYKKKENRSKEANILYELNKVYKARGDIEKSLEVLNQSILINEDLMDTTLLIKYQLDKVKSYIALNERDSALITSTLAFDLSSKINDNSYLAKSLFYIGYVNALEKDLDRSIKYLEKSLEILPYKAYDEDRRLTYKTLAEVYEKKNDYKNSYNFSQLYIQVNDSILNHDRVTSINNLSIKHQSFEKNKEIQLLEIEKESALQRNSMQRNALYFVAGGFGLLLIALYYIIRFYNQKIKTETIINEQQHEIDQQKIKELEDTMQINNMQSMIVGQEKERERIAKDLHDSLGGLLSTVKLQFDQFRSKLSPNEATSQYDKAAGLLDNAVEEVRVISRNLQPGALSKLGLIPAIKDLLNRFDGENYPEVYFQHYNLPDKINDMVALNIYRIVQELLTNTIKYAKAKEVLIQINCEDNEIYIQYEDDGKGFDLNNQEKRGMGLENIHSRIKYLKGQISIETKPDEGVSFFIKVPYYD